MTSSSTADPEPAQDTITVPHTVAQTLVEGILTGNGVSPQHAALIAQCLVLADLRGVDSHGINRIPSYVARIRHGVLDPRAMPTTTQVTPVVAQVDAHNAFGFVAAHDGMQAAIGMARTYGIGLVGVKHSNHFGMAAWLPMMAAEAGMLSLVFTNSSPALPPWGAKDKMLGVSPLACGAPAGPPVGAQAEVEGGLEERTPPFILDMAPSVAARGKIYKALRRGEKIPPGWALDRHGRPTEDPEAALDGGVMLPMGGPKGSALAIMMDVFSGVLTGSAFGGEVAGPYDPSRPADVGHFLMAIKPDLFVSAEEFRQRMGILYKKVVEAPKMQGVDRVYFPGEIEIITHERRKVDGIPYVKAEIDALNAEAQRVGAKMLEVVLRESQTVDATTLIRE